MNTGQLVNCFVCDNTNTVLTTLKYKNGNGINVYGCSQCYTYALSDGLASELDALRLRAPSNNQSMERWMAIQSYLFAQQHLQEGYEHIQIHTRESIPGF